MDKEHVQDAYKAFLLTVAEELGLHKLLKWVNQWLHRVTAWWTWH